jgi:hypothetical protein
MRPVQKPEAGGQQKNRLPFAVLGFFFPSDSCLWAAGVLIFEQLNASSFCLVLLQFVNRQS